MDFSITKGQFLQSLASVTNIIPARTTLPILSHILCQAKGQHLTLTATDLDISVSQTLLAEVKAEAGVALPARMLLEIIRALPESPIHLHLAGDRAVIECEKSLFKIMTLPAEDFPTLPEMSPSEVGLEVKGGALQKLTQHTAFAASTDESRPVLNAILWELGGNEMRMVATDGHRLAKYAVAVTLPKGLAGEYLVPPKALTQVSRLFGEEEPIKIGRSKNQLAFIGESATVYTRLVEGTYPNYQQVIPRDNDKHARCPRDLLTAALRRMAIVADPQTHRVALQFTAAEGSGELTLTVQTPDVGEAHEVLPVEYAGEELHIGFNANYLLEILRYIDSDEVRLSFKAPERAVVIVPTHLEPGEDALYLGMPMRLNE